MNILKCKFCKVKPVVLHTSDLWYHYCPKCYHHGKYFCCATTELKSAEQWNEINKDYPTTKDVEVKQFFLRNKKPVK